MKQLSLPQQIGPFEAWVKECFQQIENATGEDAEQSLSAFSSTGAFTETRTFDASSATLADIRNVLATMISDIKKRGSKRTYVS